MIHHGDNLNILPTLPHNSVQCVMTSPPYFRLRDYGVAPSVWPEIAYQPMSGIPDVIIPEQNACLGLEETPEAYVAHIVHTFRLLWDVLRDDGVVWLNIGDTYASPSKWGGSSSGKNTSSHSAPRNRADGGILDKNLYGIPWRVALALQADGWYLRSDVIWQKPTCIPESVKDRPTRSHEHVFLLAKSDHYFYDADAIAEPAVNGDPNAPRGSKDTVSPNGGRRKQQQRALEIAEQHGLTPAHIDAIRAVGLSDAGKAKVLQNGSGKNADEVQRLADEAKAVLGGYFREFLSREKRNARDVWTIPHQTLRHEHYAPMPEALAERCIRAGSRVGDIVLDPFAGSGTTLRAAERLQREAWGIEARSEYIDLAERRLSGLQIALIVED